MVGKTSLRMPPSSGDLRNRQGFSRGQGVGKAFSRERERSVRKHRGRSQVLKEVQRLEHGQQGAKGRQEATHASCKQPTVTCGEHFLLAELNISLPNRMLEKLIAYPGAGT